MGQPGRLGGDLREEPRPALAAGHLLDRAPGAVPVRGPLRPGRAAGPARRRGDRGALAGAAVAQQPADRAGGGDGIPGAAGILETPGVGRGWPAAFGPAATAGLAGRRAAAQPGRRRLPAVDQHGSRRCARVFPSSPTRGWPTPSSPATLSTRARRSTPTSRPAPRPCRSVPRPPPASMRRPGPGSPGHRAAPE